MVLSNLHTAEDIVVPDEFPKVLKSYIKDVIRTQPYDVLRWSATYFRCMANQVQPPVKTRLELEYNSNTGKLTKGFLKTLVKQLGKGYYVNRDVLQNCWKGLSLTEDELCKYLSVCRMLHQDRVHWLKAFAVMAGSLTEDFRSTMELLCELLTDELEGGPNSVPMWMFAVCYMFIAELDCSETQEFQDGRKVLKNGELEPEQDSQMEPAFISAASFRETVASEWKQCVEFRMISKGRDKITLESEEPPPSTRVMNNRLSSDYKFGNHCDAVKESTDFESIVFILSDISRYQLSRASKYTNVHNNETKISYDEAIKDIITTEETQVLQEIGAPWCWMHQFALQCCETKSYNFLEKLIEETADNAVAISQGDTDYISVFGHSTGTQVEKKVTDFNYVVEPIPGIGGPISTATVQQFLNYLKTRSKDENGMVFPRHFKEKNCPKIFDD